MRNIRPHIECECDTALTVPEPFPPSPVRAQVSRGLRGQTAQEQEAVSDLHNHHLFTLLLLGNLQGLPHNSFQSSPSQTH